MCARDKRRVFYFSSRHFLPAAAAGGKRAANFDPMLSPRSFVKLREGRAATS